MSKILQEIFKRTAYAPFFGELSGLRHIHFQRPLSCPSCDYPTGSPSVQCASDDGCSSKKDPPPSKDRPRSCTRAKKRSRRKKRTKSKTCVGDEKTDEGGKVSSGEHVDCASKRLPEVKNEPGEASDPCAARAAVCAKKRKKGKTCVDPVVVCGRKAEHKNEPCSFTLPKTAPKDTFTTIAPVCENKPKVKRTCPRKEAECRVECKTGENTKPAPASSTKVEVKGPSSPKTSSTKVEVKGPSPKASSTKVEEKGPCLKVAVTDKKRKEETKKKDPCSIPKVEEYDYSGATTEIPSPHIFKRVKEGSLGPDISKTGKYKNPEYFSYNKWTFYEAMIGIARVSTPQPSNKKPFKPPKTTP